jgi:LuxR family maltose regulon positive regulatory protein
LDEGDNDPARFWRHVAAALDPVRPGVAARVNVLLEPPSLASFEGPVTALVNELAPLGEVAVLVLDDYHLIQSREVHSSVAFLLDHMPSSLQLVLSSRADPPLPLARLRTHGQLIELRESDLRFTPDEAAELLRALVGPELPERAVATLEERTEGWAAGLQLAALALQDGGDVDKLVEGFSGRHRFVRDFLAEEVLDRQPQELRTFLLETSVLERLSGGLCDAITGRRDSQVLLEDIERAHLFLVPLDEVRGWYRYHHLFADLLYARLQRERPERVPELHRGAAAWCEAHGFADDAIRHALAAGDTTRAAVIMERQLDARILRWEGATLQRWLAALPAELVRSRPRLSLAEARLALMSGQLEAIETPLNAAEGRVADAADELYEPSVGRGSSTMANLPAAIALQRAGLAHLRGEAEQTLTYARRALAEVREGEWMLESFARWYLAVAEWLAGRLANAEAAFTSSIASWRAASQGGPAAAALGYHCLGLVQRDAGRLKAAFATYREALAVATDREKAAPQIAGVAQVGMAAVLYERGDLESALERVDEGIPLCQQLVYTPPLVTGLITLASIRQAQGDRSGALDAIGRAERVQLSRAIVGLVNPVPSARARLALAHGDVDDAARWARERGLAADDEPRYPREREHLVLARVLLATDAHGQALDLLERWLALAVTQERAGSVVEILALQALAHAGSGDEPKALAALAHALELAAAEGYLRVFVDEGAPMATLLSKLIATPATVHALASAPRTRAHLDQLIQAFERAGLTVLPRPRPGGATVPGLLEISPREMEVLRLVAAGRPNRAIAEELVVTLDTVKRHVSHLFNKLEVANRTQAVARARELGLLP